ncbi:MAG TPA: ABC transporter ATP-binding protein [Nocardioidaceae bacterium]|nr:ABC transporter ATP-binding protein [Nocardioidaceae bacterium]
MSAAAVELVDAELSFGRRSLWSHLDVRIEPGQFVAVLGPNGSGKSSLLKVVLGLLPLTSGQVRVAGRPPRRGNRTIGYVPQHAGFSVDAPLRGADFVQMGLDGGRWGLPAPRRYRAAVADVLTQVEARHLARQPVGQLSGGEQQRLRVAQALVTDPSVLLCDEPLLSLDMRHQQRVVELVDKRRREHGTAVLFVTHEINPVLAATDLVLYMMDGAFRMGTPDEVMRSDVLSELYSAPIEVVRRHGQIIVLGAETAASSHHDHDHRSLDHRPHPAGRR